MAFNIDINEIKTNIRQIKENAEKLNQMGREFPALEKNSARMLASLKMLELNFPDTDFTDNNSGRFESVIDGDFYASSHADNLRDHYNNNHGTGLDSSSFFTRDFMAIMDTALGKKNPDLVVKNAELVNVYTGEIQKNACISVCGDRIAFVGTGDDFIEGPDTKIIDAKGKIVIPGLIDGHNHLAWFVTPSEFLRYAVKGGTTTIITETMEVFPVAGEKGVEDFMASMKNQPVKIFSTAPATSSISSNVAGMSREVLHKFLLKDEILGLGESYWQTVFQSPENFLPAFEETLKKGKTLEGHSAGARGRKLAAYTGLGISSCHEPINADQVLERLRLGIYVLAREGSIRSDLEAIAPIKDMGVDLRHLCFASDSITPKELMENGYMENILQKAINKGFQPLDAIKTVTLNVAEHFGISDHVGGVAPGRYADMLIIPDINTIEPEYVISCGKVVAENGKLLVQPKAHEFKEKSKHSVNLPKKIFDRDFAVSVANKSDSVKVRVMELITDLVTKEKIVSFNVVDGEIIQDIEHDILKVAAIDRNLNPGEYFTGFLKGFGMKSGAFAATGAWDTADIITIGTNDKDMAFAVNRVHELNGGIVVCENEKIIMELGLPVFGLLSELPIEKVADMTERINKKVQDMGCRSNDPLLTMITLTGAAIPYIRICEQGLVNLKDGKPADLII